ncbi:MAG: beta-N-acetylhexosaminidase family protein [Planctomycetota bacterium]
MSRRTILVGSILWVLTVAAGSARALAGPGKIDLREAVIFTSSPQTVQAKAALMLRDEIEKRTRIRLDIVDKIPGKEKAAILIGTVKDTPQKSYSPPRRLQVPKKAEGYAIWVDTDRDRGVRVWLLGRDERGALFAAGRLLRLLDMDRDRLELAGDVRISTAPKYSLRGHQVGYRPKTNSYDGWTVQMWEQYFRDLVVFGTNAVELIPPRSDDDADSPHFPKPKLEMMIAMSQLADDYGLDVWIWYVSGG